MALTEAQVNAGWAEYNCPKCGEPNGILDTVEQVGMTNGVGIDDCENCDDPVTFEFIMGLRG